MSARIPQTMALVFLLVAVMILPVGYAVDWSLDMRLTWNSAPDEMPSLMRAGDGRIWVFWQSRRTGSYDIFYKIYNASSAHQWSAETQLTLDSNWDFLPSAMQAANGKIWIAWASNRTNGGFFYDIFYKVNNGSAWSADTRLTFDASNDRFPSIAQTNDGRIWVFWTSRRNGNDDIFYKITADDGATWSPDTFFLHSHATDGDWDPAAMRSADGNLWLFWVRSPSEVIYYSVFDGSSWSSPNSLTGGGGLESWHPATAQTNDGKIWVVWDKGSDSVPTDIYYKTTSDNGANWSSDIQFTTQVNDDSGPSIAQDSQGTILIAWSSNRGGGTIQPNDLFYRTSSLSPSHDVELFSVVPNATIVVLGEIVSIEVVARNRGTSSETSVEVRCYLNSTLLGSGILNMAPGELSPLYFAWDTSGSVYANYTLSANVTSVPGEVSVSDNSYLDGMVEITEGAVAAFSVSPVFPQPGELVTFNATLSQPSSGSIVSYKWGFGDGNVTVLSYPVVNHAYQFSGSYGVNLTVTDSQGLTDSTRKIVSVAIHDVAVAGGSVYDKAPWSAGVTCYVNVANEGDVLETVAVVVYFDDTFVGFEYVDVPQGSVAFNVPIWCDTSQVSPGSYVVKAEALAVVGERDLSDNVMNVGSLWVYVLDMSVVSIVPLLLRTYVGHTVNVTVEVENEGTVDADAQLQLYFNDTLIEQRAIFLFSQELKTFEFMWNTSGVSPGMYKLKAVVVAQVRIVGDVNDDGAVNEYDLGEFAGSFGSTPGSSNWNTDSDIKKDGIVDVYDLRLIGRNYGKTNTTEVGFVELDTLDNLSIYDDLQVKIVGDANGDGLVNEYDLGVFADSFGSALGSSNWNADSDFKRDNVVDVYDLRLIGRNYGQTNP
jgi:hypothetical protein